MQSVVVGQLETISSTRYVGFLVVVEEYNIQQVVAVESPSEGVEQTDFLPQFEDCFSETLPSELPLQRHKGHAIDIVLGNSPLNKPPYRMNAAQHEE